MDIDLGLIAVLIITLHVFLNPIGEFKEALPHMRLRDVFVSVLILFFVFCPKTHGACLN